MQLLEGDQRAQERAGFARFHAGRQQEQERVEVVLLWHHLVLAQVLGDDGGGDAVPGIEAALPVEARRQQDQLIGVGNGVVRRYVVEAVPARVGRELPVAR